MDTDTNGHITRPELESYLKQLAPRLSRQVKLRVAGRELPLVPLYDPEVDLIANDQTGPGHHRLRLCFFAPTPPTLRAGDEIVVEDSLWPGAKILGTVQAEGRDVVPLLPKSQSLRAWRRRDRTRRICSKFAA